MMNSSHRKLSSVAQAVALAFGLGAAAASCTPATPAPNTDGTGGQVAPTGTGGSNSSSGSGGESHSGGATGATSSGGAPGSGGTPGTGSGGSLSTGGTSSAGTGGSGTATGGTSASGTGGATAGGASGTGGASATGGTSASGTGGSSTTGSGGAGVAMGCNWVDDPVAKTSKFGTPAPADKIVLFDGTTLTGWHKQGKPGTPIDWKLGTDGTLLVVPSGSGQAVEVQTDMTFNDLCVHVEYLTPEPTTYRAANDVQDQGNSGVYLRSAYEMQVLDTHDSAPLIDGCGAVYQVQAPYSTACFQHGIWNTYEIEFKGPVWSGTTQSKLPQFVKVALNGTVVQGISPFQPNSKPVDVPMNPTKAGVMDTPGNQPFGLQDHLDPVKFRNIWVTIPKY
jgi:hypothetical protein